MHETDLPCSDCGTELVERIVHVDDLAVVANWQGYVPVAECPDCDARYYSEDTLSRLTNYGRTIEPNHQ